jgi:hypothetical protein
MVHNGRQTWRELEGRRRTLMNAMSAQWRLQSYGFDL